MRRTEHAFITIADSEKALEGRKEWDLFLCPVTTCHTTWEEELLQEGRQHCQSPAHRPPPACDIIINLFPNEEGGQLLGSCRENSRKGQDSGGRSQPCEKAGGFWFYYQEVGEKIPVTTGRKRKWKEERLPPPLKMASTGRKREGDPLASPFLIVPDPTVPQHLPLPVVLFHAYPFPRHRWETPVV